LENPSEAISKGRPISKRPKYFWEKVSTSTNLKRNALEANLPKINDLKKVRLSSLF